MRLQSGSIDQGGPQAHNDTVITKYIQSSQIPEEMNIKLDLVPWLAVSYYTTNLVLLHLDGSGSSELRITGGVSMHI